MSCGPLVAHLSASLVLELAVRNKQAKCSGLHEHRTTLKGLELLSSAVGRIVPTQIVYAFPGRSSGVEPTRLDFPDVLKKGCQVKGNAFRRRFDVCSLVLGFVSGCFGG
jgi:hypothetical protein